MRLDSPAVLATAGTLAIHLLLAIAGDAIVVLNPVSGYEPPPQVELIDVQPVAPPPEPPEPPPEEQPQPEVPEAPKPAVQPVQKVVTRRSAPPPSDQPPPPQTETSTSSGGAPIAAMEGMPPPSATGVPVVGGMRPGDRIGRGGTGTGTGAGSGTGSSDAPKPASIATIKKQAMPKGDFGYIDAAKEYPAEAKSLGIEGTIRVRLLVDQNGKVKAASLLSRLGHGLDELALAKAKQIEFEPARDTDDKPVSSQLVWTFQMTLPK